MYDVSQSRATPVSRRNVLAGTGAALGMSIIGQRAAHADFPDRQIKLVVPYPAGGGMDTIARAISPKLAQSLGQTVVVENKSGGSGLIGIMEMVRAKPDGATVLIHAMGFVMNAAMYRNLPYDPVKDVQPVANIGFVPVVVAIGPNIPAKNLAEFIKLAKADPKRYKGAAFATGAGTLMLQMFAKSAGIDMPIVQYRGTNDAISATAGGEADVVVMDGASVVPHIKAGRLKGLVVAGTSRLSEINDVPTTAEAGLPDFKLEFWYGAFVRKGTPMAAVERLNADINKAALDPEVTERLKALLLTPANRNVSQFESQWMSEMQNWQDVLKKSDFKPMEL